MQNTARQTRENRTITVDFQNEATYVQLWAMARRALITASATFGDSA